MPPPRLSGLARQVLALHRDLLRAARTKDPEARLAFVSQIRQEFERHRRLDVRDIFSIEHHIRQGRKKLELLRSSSVTRAARTGAD